MRIVLKILKVCLILLILLIVAVVGYVIYVFSTYYRLEDNIALDTAFNNDSVAQTGKEYSILSWNVGFGAYSDDYSFFMDGGKYSRAFSKDAVKENINEIIKAIDEQTADFIVLQEVDSDATRSYNIDESYMFIKAFEGYASSFAQNYDSPYLFWPPLSPHGKSQSGIMMLSKFGITSSVRRSLPVETGVYKLLDLDRCYTVTKTGVSDGRSLCIYNVHLSAYTKDGTVADEQIKLLVADMQAEADAGNYVVCAGDFNKNLLVGRETAFSADYGDYTWAQDFNAGLLPEGFTLEAPYDPENPVASSRNADKPYVEGGDNLLITVDGFIVSSNVEVVDCRVIDKGFKNSDHNPVILKFILSESGE